MFGDGAWMAERAEFKETIRRIRNNDLSITEFRITYYSELRERLDDDDINQLLAALSTNTHLVWLELTCNTFGDDHAKKLADIIANDALPLNKLQLNSGKISDIGAAALSKLLIRNSSSLKSLCVHNNEIRDHGAASFAKALEYNSTLESLILSSNYIGCDGATELFNVLEKNSTLRELHLFGNRIGCRAAKALSKALKKNTTVQDIQLQCNPIMEDGWKALDNSMTVNTTLTRIPWYHEDSNINDACRSIVESVSGMAARNSVFKNHKRGIEEFGAAFYVRRAESSGQLQWAPLSNPDLGQGVRSLDENGVFSFPKPVWEALTGDGMTLELLLIALSNIVKNDPRDVEALKLLVETSKVERNGHGDTLLHAAATKNSSAAVNLCLFLIEEVGVDTHRLVNQIGRSVFNVASSTMPILPKMEFARFCRDGGNAHAYVDALIGIVEEPRGVESVLYYLIREKPEVVSASFWDASSSWGHA